jgi:hypothetical protein
LIDRGVPDPRVDRGVARRQHRVGASEQTQQRQKAGGHAFTLLRLKDA